MDQVTKLLTDKVGEPGIAEKILQMAWRMQFQKTLEIIRNTQHIIVNDVYHHIYIQECEESMVFFENDEEEEEEDVFLDLDELIQEEEVQLLVMNMVNELLEERSPELTVSTFDNFSI